MKNISEWLDGSSEIIYLESSRGKPILVGEKGFHTVTKKHVKKLLKSKVICIDDGEYCHFKKIDGE